MTTLAADITYDQINIPISGPITDGTPRYPLYFEIDSEKIRVHDGLATTSWVIERGVAGTVAAAHSSGATLTRYSPSAIEIPSSGSGSVTGEQVIRRIDTTLAYNTPNIEDSNVGVELLVPTVGSIILEAIGQLKTAWATCDSAQFVVDVVPYYNNVHELDLMAATNVWEAGLDYTIASTFSTIASSDRVKNETSPRVPGIVTGEYAVTQEEPARVIAYVNRTGDAPTAGEINVILIVLEPAA